MKSELSKSEQIKKYLSKKMVLGFTALLMGVAIIVVCSIIPLAIEPSKWNSAEFISDEIILVALTIMGEVCLALIGQGYNQAQPMSKIARATTEFEKSLEENIGNQITAFDQWVKQRLEPHDQEDKYLRLLHNQGIENTNYLKLEREELKKCLVAPQKINGIYYRQITKNQYKMILEIMDGKYSIRFVSCDIYRKLSKIDNDKTISEKLSNQQKKRSATLVASVFSKSILVVCSGLIFGALVPTGGSFETTTMLMKLFTRMFCFASAGFFGFFVGQQINDIDAEYIADKVDVHKRYKSDVDFKPLTEQELARSEFIESVKTQNREYMIELKEKENGSV